MNLDCDHALPLIPSYLDAELSEAQAQPLRAHLLACPACREVAKDGRALRRWFVAEPAPAVPEGFAARVARRAFAGDEGVEAPAREAAQAVEGSLLPFVLRLTAAAAAVLLGLAVLLQFRARPTPAGELRASDLEQVWEEIYGLESPAETGSEPDPAAPDPAPAPSEADPEVLGPRLRGR